MFKLNEWSRTAWINRLVNLALIVICFFAMIPIATTIIISFKEQADITRKPPVLFPCDTPTSKFRSQCLSLGH